MFFLSFNIICFVTFVSFDQLIYQCMLILYFFFLIHDYDIPAISVSFLQMAKFLPPVCEWISGATGVEASLSRANKEWIEGELRGSGGQEFLRCSSLNLHLCKSRYRRKNIVVRLPLEWQLT